MASAAVDTLSGLIRWMIDVGPLRRITVLRTLPQLPCWLRNPGACDALLIPMACIYKNFVDVCRLRDGKSGIEMMGTTLTRSNGLKVRSADPNGCTDAVEDILRTNDMCMVTPSGPQALLL